MEKARLDRLRDDLRTEYGKNRDARVSMKVFTVLELIGEIDRMRPIIERQAVRDLSRGSTTSTPDFLKDLFAGK